MRLRQPRILILAIRRREIIETGVIVRHFFTYTSDKSYGSWDACHDCRAYATELQARFKRRNVHCETPDISLHSCVSLPRHPQTWPPRIVRVDPWQSSSNRRRRDACLVSNIVAIASLINFTAITKNVCFTAVKKNVRSEILKQFLIFSKLRNTFWL